MRLSVLVAEVFETDVDIVAGECRRDDAYQVVPDAVAAVRVVFEQETLRTIGTAWMSLKTRTRMS